MSAVPRIVFIVPYRNRHQQKQFFSTFQTSVMGDRDDYEIYFSHQCDARTFNRGATKNIGFLAIKAKYPEHYKDITFVFNDIDTVPFAQIFDYETSHGVVKHFYGFKYALGGIVSLTGADFEATNGYPNFWGWGMEDNVLQKRCEKIGLHIDRSHFFPIGSPDIIHLFDGVSRIINRKDPWRATHDNGQDGIRTIHKLAYEISYESKNPVDNVHTVHMDNVFMINIETFMTSVRFEHDNYHRYDLREPPRKIVHPDRVQTNKIENLTDDWTHIPYYPSQENRTQLVQQYGEEQAEEIIQYSYENSEDPTVHVMPPHLQGQQHGQQQHFNGQQALQQQAFQPMSQLQQIQQYNEAMRSQNVDHRIIPPNINKFSPAYARIVAAKPKATASAKIRLGGVYK